MMTTRIMRYAVMLHVDGTMNVTLTTVNEVTDAKNGVVIRKIKIMVSLEPVH